MPAAKMRPSGSKAATGRPASFIRPCESRCWEKPITDQLLQELLYSFPLINVRVLFLMIKIRSFIFPQISCKTARKTADNENSSIYLTVIAPQVPQSDRLVKAARKGILSMFFSIYLNMGSLIFKEQPAREEGLISRVHGHCDNSLVVASKVPDVLVLSQGHVSLHGRYR